MSISVDSEETSNNDTFGQSPSNDLRASITYLIPCGGFPWATRQDWTLTNIKKKYCEKYYL